FMSGWSGRYGYHVSASRIARIVRRHRVRPHAQGTADLAGRAGRLAPRVEGTVLLRSLSVPGRATLRSGNKRVHHASHARRLDPAGRPDTRRDDAPGRILLARTRTALRRSTNRPDIAGRDDFAHPARVPRARRFAVRRRHDAADLHGLAPASPG